jgi:cytochrome c oxidase assembly protein subunit 15
MPAYARHTARTLPPPVVGWWLVLCCAMVVAMVLLGGVTRLTESGLSIVSWRPFTGIFPPWNDAEWQTLFAAYKNSPEFTKVNFWMTVDDFKSIFWLEFLHRLWGRLIGLVFLLPFLWFAARRMLDRGMILQMAGLFCLGGLQGLMGWYMVKSGLVDRPDVSQYRLAAHLGLAFIIYGWLLWLAFRCLSGARGDGQDSAMRRHTLFLLFWVSVTILWGAVVAGIDAGLAYNTFPLMDGRLVPADMLMLEPAWTNFFENTATVQFTHRVLGTGLVVIAVTLWWRSRIRPISNAAARAIGWLAIIAALQMALGVSTLLSEVAMPIALLHQAVALVVIGMTLRVLYTLGTVATGDRLANNTAPSR